MTNHYFVLPFATLGKMHQAKTIFFKTDQLLSKLLTELFFSYAFFMTNLSETFSPKVIVTSYQNLGTMEILIKEAKDGFGFDQMKSHDYIVNEARMMMSLLAYNLTNWLRMLSFPPVAKSIQIQTIRTRLVKVAI